MHTLFPFSSLSLSSFKDHPNITTVRPHDLIVPMDGFDAVLAISSFDHDGLGRCVSCVIVPALAYLFT